MMIFVDPFSLYDSLTLMAKSWDVISAQFQAGRIVQSTTSGRFGGGGVTFINPTTDLANDHPYFIQKNYDGVATIICGFAIRQTATQNARGGRLLTFVDGSTTQLAIDILQSGQLRATRASAVGTGIILAPSGSSPQITPLGTSVNTISSSAFDFLEFKIVHHPSAGSVTVKRNGEDFWELTGQNTAVSGNNQSASVCVGGYTSFNNGVGANMALQAVISDFHLLNTTVNGDDALDPVDFIGDRRWQPRLPASDGTYAEWTPNPGPDHFDNVNEIPPNSGTTENNTETVGARDSFNCDAATGPTTASVILAYTMFLEKNAGGSVGISGIFRSGGADRNGTEFQAINPYAYRQSFLCSKPGGGAITVADVNAGEHGYERTS